jgi:hypothetical protein
LWSVFVLPVVGIHYLLRLVRAREARGVVAFTVTSLFLHGASCAFWRVTAGSWTPFLDRLSATYPVDPGNLVPLLLTYPRLLWDGSPLGNTLFGAVPLLLVVGLVSACVWPRGFARSLRVPGVGLERVTFWLLSTCAVFFGLLEFFPNNFSFDRYYSVPRIFRYLAPLSYGFSLLAALLLLRLARGIPARFGLRPLAAVGVLAVVAAGIPEAVGPTREHRARVTALRAELRASCPPEVLLNPWQARFFRELYLREACPGTLVPGEPIDASAADSERWLHAIEPQLRRGAVLVTGLPSHVYYVCPDCGFRLDGFEGPLDPRWTLVDELAPLRFGDGEPVRLWRGEGEGASGGSDVPIPDLPPAALFAQGIERFDALDYPGTRRFMGALVERFPDHARAPRAAYVVAVSYWRENDPHTTIREFEALLEAFPGSPVTVAAYYHIGLSYRMLRRYGEARSAFEAAVRLGSENAPERGYSARILEGLPGSAPLEDWGERLTDLVYAFQAWPSR